MSQINSLACEQAFSRAGWGLFFPKQRACSQAKQSLSPLWILLRWRKRLNTTGNWRLVNGTEQTE